MIDTTRLFIDAWKLLAGRFPAPLIQEADGVATSFANVPLLFFNLSIQARPAPTAVELRALFATSAERAALCPHPSGLLLREDWLPDGWLHAIEEAGLAPMVPMTGMEAAGLLPPRRPAPVNLEVRRVVNEKMARDLAQLNAHAYGIPAELFECICDMRIWHDDSHAFVGYVDGKPVSSAASLPVAGTVYVALVATLPEAQGKGYAEAVMRCAVAQGQQAMEVTTTTLHATAMGAPLYRAMGYQTGPKLVLVAPPH